MFLLALKFFPVHVSLISTGARMWVWLWRDESTTDSLVMSTDGEELLQWCYRSCVSTEYKGWSSQKLQMVCFPAFFKHNFKIFEMCKNNKIILYSYSFCMTGPICGYIDQTEVYGPSTSSVHILLYNHILTEFKSYNCYIINRNQQINNCRCWVDMHVQFSDWTVINKRPIIIQ